LTPGTANQGVLDYTTERGSHVYKEAIKSLYRKGEDSFSGEEEQLQTFLNRLEDRANAQGWHSTNAASLLTIPTNYDAAGVAQGPFKSLIKNHGEIELAAIKAYEEKINGTNDRLKQSLYHLYTCLMNSLSVEGDAMIKLWKNEIIHYPQNGGLIHGGLSLLKVIIRESSLDANASTESLRRRLTELDTYAISVNGNIKKINAQAKHIVDGLAARGHKTTELVTNLFKAYETIQCGPFMRYIEAKKNTHDEGHKPTNANTLMVQTNEKYKMLTERGEWEISQDPADRILALEAQLKSIKGKFNKNSNNNKKKKKGVEDKKKPADEGKEPRPEWLKKNIKPSDSEIHLPKIWNSRPYFYCGKETGGHCNGVWRCHHPSVCTQNKYKKPTGDNGEKNDKKRKGKYAGNKDKSNKKKIINAFAALTKRDESEGEDEDDELSTYSTSSDGMDVDEEK